MRARPAAVPSPSERFYRLQDLAQEWGLSLRELYREVAEGSLVVHRFGRALRVAASDKQAYLAARRCGPGRTDIRNTAKQGGSDRAHLQSPIDSHREYNSK